MTFRLDEKTALQGVVQHMLGTHESPQESGLHLSLLERVSMRVSRITGANQHSIAFRYPQAPFTIDANEAAAAD